MLFRDASYRRFAIEGDIRKIDKCVNCMSSLTCKACLQADGAHLVRVSRIAVAVWAIIMGIAMCIAQVAGINVNWLVLLIGEPLQPQAACLSRSGCLRISEL